MPAPEELANWASALESVAVAIAVILGGLWTLFTFRRLGATKRAQSELAELEQKLSRTAQLNIDVEAWSQTLDNDAGFLLFAQATVSNVGSRRTNLQFPANKRPFHANRVQPLPDGSITVGATLSAGIPYGDGSMEFSGRAIVGPGAKVVLPVVFHVASSGVYLVSFSASPSVDVHESLGTDGVPNASTAQWTGRCYASVGLPSTSALDERDTANPRGFPKHEAERNGVVRVAALDKVS